jgi:hypothetical protein
MNRLNRDQEPRPSTSKTPNLRGNFGHLTVDKLKLELAKRGAKTTGRKAELIERLEAYDRNQDFSSTSVIIPAEVPMTDWPERTFFRSITASHREELPRIEHSQIEQYVIYRQCADNSENQVKLRLKS